MFKSILINIGTAVLTVLLLLILTEAMFRLLSPPAVTADTSDRPRWYYVPARSFEHKDYSYEKTKPEGVFRIAAIGDSFTFPPSMQFDDAWPKRLERMLNLNDRGRSGQAEVINFGEWGGSSLSEVRDVKQALSYSPDLIVLEITLNDPPLKHYDDEVRRLFHSFTISPEHNWLLYYWKSLGYLVTRFNNAQSHRKYIEFHRALFERGDTWRAFGADLRFMNELCRAQGVKFAAFVFPFVHYGFGAEYPLADVHQKIDFLLDSFPIPHLDLLPAFDGVNPQRMVIEPNGDMHPNEIAHRIVADAVYNWLEREELIPPAIRISKKLEKRSKSTGRVGEHTFDS